MVCRCRYWSKEQYRRQRAAYAKMRKRGRTLLDEAVLAWRGLTNAQQVVGTLTAVQTAIFLAWQLPFKRSQGVMLKYFLQQPFSGRLFQMIGSSVSHQNLLHFGLNTWVRCNCYQNHRLPAPQS